MRQARPGSAINALVGLVLVIAAGLAAWTLADEIAVQSSRSRLDGEASVSRAAPARDLARPRAILAEALVLARRAEALPQGVARSALLERAAIEAAKASSARAHWGEAWLVRAFVAALANPDGADAVSALARSYADARFLRHGAEWRVEYGIARWAALDAKSRGRLIDEAIVFAQLNPDSSRRVFDLARGSGAYRPLVAAWHGVLRERQLGRAD